MKSGTINEIEYYRYLNPFKIIFFLINHFLYRSFFLLVPLLLLGANADLKGQDSLPGAYQAGINANPYQEIIFELDGRFKCNSDRINPGRTFYGSWARINDSTVRLHADTALTLFTPCTCIPKTPKIVSDEFYCIQSKKDTMLIICYFNILDTLNKPTKYNYELLFFRISAFHSFGKYKQYTNYFNDNIKVITTFYPNGNVNEITTYRKGKEHGNSLLYDVSGNLSSITYYKKGRPVKFYRHPKGI